MKKNIFCIILLIFSIPPLMSMTTYTFTPYKNELLFTHTSHLMLSETDTLSYSLLSTNKDDFSSTISFKFLSLREHYSLHVGDITKDIRIMLLSGEIYSSTRSLSTYNNSLSVQLSESPTISLALTQSYKSLSIHPFIITHLYEQERYLSGGVVVDSTRISSGLSFLSSSERTTCAEPLFMFNQKPLMKGFSSFLLLKKDNLTLFDIYTLNLRLGVTQSIPITQIGSSAYILDAKVQKGRQQLTFKKTYYPQYSYLWNEIKSKEKSVLSSLEYTYKAKWFTLSYDWENELYTKGVFAYLVAPATRSYLFTLKGENWVFSYRTKVEVSEKNKRKDEKKVSLSYSLYDFTLSSSLTYKNSSPLFYNKITYTHKLYRISVELDTKKRVSYTLKVNKQKAPFDLLFSLTSKNVMSITFTIDR